MIADISPRSEKIRAGLYRCGEFTIERTKTGWPPGTWFVHRSYGTPNQQTVGSFICFAEAYDWCRALKMESV